MNDHPRFTHRGNACTRDCGNFDELTALRMQRERLLARIQREASRASRASRLDLSGIDLNADTMRAAFYDDEPEGPDPGIRQV